MKTVRSRADSGGIPHYLLSANRTICPIIPLESVPTRRGLNRHPHPNTWQIGSGSIVRLPPCPALAPPNRVKPADLMRRVPWSIPLMAAALMAIGLHGTGPLRGFWRGSTPLPAATTRLVGRRISRHARGHAVELPPPGGVELCGVRPVAGAPGAGLFLSRRQRGASLAANWSESACSRRNSPRWRSCSPWHVT